MGTESTPPTEVSNLEDIVLHADDNVRLINLLAPEKKDYKEWVDEQFFWQENRPERHYLTEHTFILEEDFELFYVNEQTSEEKLVLDGEIIKDDITKETKRDFEEVYFWDKIDEHKFVYQKFFDQWMKGCGIFDLSDFSDHPISIAGEDRSPWSIYGEYVYTLDSVRFAKTNADTYETTRILTDLPEDGKYFVASKFSPDGKLFAARLSGYDAGNSKMGSFSVNVYEVEKGELLAVFNIFVEESNAGNREGVSFFWLFFKDNTTICVIERDLDSPYGPLKYLAEIDISGIG